MAGSSQNPLTVLLGVDLGNLPAGMQAAASAVQGSTARMRAAFAGVGSAMNGLMAPLAALGAILAGGAVFKKAIDYSQEWNLTAGKLAKTLGTTTEQASVYMVAVDDLGVSQEMFGRAANMMMRQVAGGGAGFKKLGVDIKDTNGHLKPVAGLMEEANAKIRTITNSTAQGAAGIAIYGRAWPEVRKVIELTGEKMEEAKVKATKLGLIVGPDGVENAKAYKLAMKDVGEIGESMAIAIGNKLTPVLKGMGEWFGEKGPTAVEYFGEFLKGLSAIFLVLKAVIENVWDLMAWFFEAGGKGFAAVAAAANAAIHGQFGEAKQILSMGWQDVLSESGKTAKSMEKTWVDSWASIEKLWAKPKKSKDKGSGDEGGLDMEKDGEKMKRWEQELSARKASADKVLSWTLGAEKAFWASKLATTQEGSDLNLDLQKRINDMSVALYKEGFDKELTGYRQFLALYKDDTEVQLAITKLIAQRTVEEYGAGSTQAIAALNELEQAEKAIREKTDKTRADALKKQEEFVLRSLEIAAEEVRGLAAAGFISPAEELSRLATIEDAKLKVRQDSAAQQLLLENLTKDQRIAIENELTKATQDAEAKSLKLTQQGMKARVEELKGYVEPMVNAISDVFEGVLNGSIKATDAVQKVFTAMKNTLIKTFVDIASNWVKQQLVMLLMKKSAAATEIATDATVTTAKVAGNVSEVTSNAAVAGSGAASAVAEIPIVGPALAIAAMAAVAGAVIASMGSMASASGGFDIGNFSPLTQLHPNEMVLPAKHADVIRSLADQGGVGRGETTNISINAVDGQSVLRLFKRNDRALDRVQRNLVRAGRP